MHACLLPAAHGPLRRVPPIRIRRQHGVSVQRLTRLSAVVEFAVLRCRRPIHQPLRLIRRVVKLVYPQRLCHAPRNRLIFIPPDLPVERYHEPQPRAVWPVRVGGVAHSFHARPCRRETFPQLRPCLVGVQRHQRAAYHVALLPASLIQSAAHEAAHVLHARLLVLAARLTRPRGVFRRRISRPLRLPQTVCQCIPVPRFRGPPLRVTSRSGSYIHLK